jgi:hypothetical protein
MEPRRNRHGGGQTGEKEAPMFRLLFAVLVYWALTSSGATPEDFRQLVEWVSAHVHVTVR